MPGEQITVEIVPTVAQGAIEAIKSAVGEAVMTKVAKGVAGQAGAAIGGAAMLPGLALGGLGAVMTGITGLVQAANPAMVQQLGNAFKDVFAVVGQALTPALELFIPLVQAWGDFIASILPDQEVLNGLFAEFKPIVDAMVTVMQELAPVIKEVITVLARLLSMLMRNFVSGLEVLGLLPGAGKGFTSSARGASFVGAQTVGVEQLGRGLMEGSLSSGTRTDYARQTADQITQLNGKVPTNQPASQPANPGNITHAPAAARAIGGIAGFFGINAGGAAAAFSGS